MKQFQTEYRDEGSFSGWLREIQRCCELWGILGNEKLFHIYTDSSDYGLVEPVVALIRQHFPGAPYAGISGHGAIIHGATAARHIVVVSTVYERPDSRVEVVQLPLTYATQEASADALLAAVKARPWVKSIEMLTTVGGVNMPLFCRKLAVLPKGVQFYGGGALATDVYDGHAVENLVFSSAAGRSPGSAAFVLRGGAGLHIHTRYLTGWRRLGMPFTATSARGNVLAELNGKPALELYRHYLNMPLDERFFELAVVFPICFERDGVPCLRATTSFREDGALIMGADIEEGSVGNIAYGDPVQIMKRINESLAALQDFAPDVIQLFSCGSRQFFWGPDVDRETLPFNSIAPTSGFYTSGEFLRSNREVLLHNVTMVIAGMREGDAATMAHAPVQMDDLSRPNMINNCLTTFINKAAEELKEANEKLFEMAVTDGLTGLYNHTEIERRVRSALDEYRLAPQTTRPPVVVMLDLDFFKSINDAHGHQEGDAVLRAVSGLFRQARAQRGEALCVGRWGGEEFMCLIRDMGLDEAGKFVEALREDFAGIDFPGSGRHTLSAGVTRAAPQDTTVSLIGRADKALYRAKEQGRNRSVVL